MVDTGEGFTSADCRDSRRFGDAAAEMFVEVQRSDTKATTLCGVTGGLLAVDAAALSAAPRPSWLPGAALACAAVLLGIALVVALSAIRPVLPRRGGLRTFAGPVPEQGGPKNSCRLSRRWVLVSVCWRRRSSWCCSPAWLSGNSVR